MSEKSSNSITAPESDENMRKLIAKQLYDRLKSFQRAREEYYNFYENTFAELLRDSGVKFSRSEVLL